MLFLSKKFILNIMFSFLVVTLFSSFIIYGADPFSTVNTNLTSTIKIVQKIALSIAVLGLVGFIIYFIYRGHWNWTYIISFVVGIIIIAGAVPIVEWISTWVG